MKMKYKEISIQFLNRIVGIIVWVALWNLIDLIIKEDDILVNSLVAIFGLVVWGFLGEYTIQQQRQYSELTPV